MVIGSVGVPQVNLSLAMQTRYTVLKLVNLLLIIAKGLDSLLLFHFQQPDNAVVDHLRDSPVVYFKISGVGELDHHSIQIVVIPGNAQTDRSYASAIHAFNSSST